MQAMPQEKVKPTTSSEPVKPQEYPPFQVEVAPKTSSHRKLPLVAGILLVIVGLVSWQKTAIMSLFPQLTPQESTQSQSTQTADSSDLGKVQNFFYTAIPKPLDKLTIFDLPNYRVLLGAAKYKDHIWFTGNGTIIEYNPQTNAIVSYSNAEKAYCFDDLVQIDKYLYTVCHMINKIDPNDVASDYRGREYSDNQIFKINTETHTVENIYSSEDGLLSGENYRLYLDGEILWIATFDGVGRLDTKTEKIEFYTTELGFAASSGATKLAINRILIDPDYVWVENTASAVSQGGVAVLTKATGEWRAFGPRAMKDEDLDRIDLQGLKLIPGGIQVAFRDGNVGDYEKLVEKQYLYSTGTWQKVGKDRVATGEESEATFDYIEKAYPPRWTEYDQINAEGFAELVMPGSNEVYQVSGRDNFIISPIVDGKRYILTNASVDVVDENSDYPQILVKLGEDLGDQNVHGYFALPLRELAFLVEPELKLALVLKYICEGDWCSEQRVGVSIVDLENAKILKKNDFRQPKNFNLDVALTLEQRDGKLAVLNPDGTIILEINLSNYSYDLPPEPAAAN